MDGAAILDEKGGGDGMSHGKIWWMERELAERKKFMPLVVRVLL
jgi:hypothetical protein